ncbi:hypothetical protein ACTNCI_06055 [Mitsuokella jalaludinii]|uniref:hypothetical protein n=1 Tax=Mitsuokella jalaludinii TaxID=187979 RepID=UPI003F8CAB8A
MRIIVDVPEHQGTELYRYLKEHDIPALLDGTDTLSYLLPKERVEEAARAYIEEHPVLKDFCKESGRDEGFLTRASMACLRADFDWICEQDSVGLEQSIRETVEYIMEIHMGEMYEFRKFQQKENVTQEEIDKAREYIFSDAVSKDLTPASFLCNLQIVAGESQHMLSCSITNDRDTYWKDFGDLIRSTADINQHNAVVCEDMQKILTDSLSKARKAFFLSNPKMPVDEQIGRFLRGDDPNKELVSAYEKERVEQLAPAIESFAAKMGEVSAFLRETAGDTNRSPEDLAIESALMYQDAAKELARFLPESISLRTTFREDELPHVSLRTTFREDELPQGRWEDYRKGEALLSVLRRRTLPDKEDDRPAMGVLKEVYTRRKDTVCFGKLDRNAAKILFLRDGKAKDIREIGAVTSTLHPGIDAKTYGKKLEKDSCSSVFSGGR